jgi:hypothetical protein
MLDSALAFAAQESERSDRMARFGGATRQKRILQSRLPGES